MKLLSCFLVLGLIGAGSASLFPNRDDTLIMAQVVFRHGDRTPGVLIDYPNFSMANDTFFPYGIGQLTLKGKRSSYKLGTELYQRYGKFLGSQFYPELILAISSESGRAIMSLQAVLASLIKPSLKEKLAFGLDWQPILYKYINFEDDRMLAIHENCWQVFEVETKIDDQTQLIYDYLSLNLGTTINGSFAAFGIQNNIQVLEEMGYDLPEWVKPIWPEPLTTVGLQFWKDLVEQKLPLASGYLMKTLNENMLEKLNGTQHKDRKLLLYSGHDLNVISVLGSLGVYDGRYIKYSSYVSLELHKIKGIYGIKAFLQNYETRNPVLISIPNCGQFCPLEIFIEITKKNYPLDPWCY